MSNCDDLKGSLWWAQVISTGLTTVGSLWMINYSWVKAPRPISDIALLVGAIGFADLIYAFPNALSLLGCERGQYICRVEGFTRQLFFVSVFLVISAAMLCYRQASQKQKVDPTSQRCFVITAIISSFLLAIGLALVPFGFPGSFAYGDTNVHCWIKAPKNSQNKVSLDTWAVIIFEIFPYLLGILMTLYYYCRAKGIADTGVGKRASKQFGSESLFWYPAALIFVFSFSVINDWRFAQEKKLHWWCELAHILLTHSIGLIDAILYGCQRRRAANANVNQVNVRENFL